MKLDRLIERYGARALLALVFLPVIFTRWLPQIGNPSIPTSYPNTISAVNVVCSASSADCGTLINGAYAALPANGGTIWLSTNSLCVNYSVPIVMSTIGKYAILSGVGPGATFGTTQISGTCLNYVPITATFAITTDWAPTTGQSSFFEQASGIRNLTLINNLCTSGGCGSSAEGIHIGGTNGGVQQGDFNDIRVLGFNIGIHNVDTTGDSWGIKYQGIGLAGNATGFSQDTTEEGTRFNLSTIANNGIGIKLGGGGTTEFIFFGGSFDYNTTAGLETIGGNYSVTFNGVHFEDNHSPINFVVNAGVNPNITLIGGEIFDTNTSGTLSTSMFTCGACYSFGTSIKSSGRTFSGADIFAANSASSLFMFNNSSALYPVNDFAFAGGSTFLMLMGGTVPSFQTGSQPIATGSVSVTGTGACVTIATPSGGQWAGRGTCTGVTGASTLTIAVPASLNNNSCFGSDITAKVVAAQSASAPGSCTLNWASVTQNDIISWGVIGF